MARNRLNSLLGRLFWGTNLLHQKRDQTPLVRGREPNSDELALGYAYGFDENEQRDLIQLKGVPQKDRAEHMYVVGGTGVGKTRFLLDLILQDIINGHGFGVLDLHGDLTTDILGYCATAPALQKHQERIALIDPTNKTRTITFNPLEQTNDLEPSRIAHELVAAFKHIWAEAWGERMAGILRNVLIALIENNLTLLELPEFVVNKSFRDQFEIKDIICQQYFQHFNELTPKIQREWAESTLNKVNAFLSDPAVRHMLMAAKSTINLRRVMDQGKILLIRLDKGNLGESADLLGALLLSKFKMAAFSRTDTAKSQRRLFYLYLDEFQNFGDEHFIEILSEARKYRLSLILAHQNLEQLNRKVLASILANAALQVFFQISRADAQVLAHEALTAIYAQPPGWEGYVQAMQSLERRSCFVRSKVEGGVVHIYTREVNDPSVEAALTEDELARAIVKMDCGGKYMRRRDTIEAEYQERWQRFGLTKKAKKDWETFAEPEK